LVVTFSKLEVAETLNIRPRPLGHLLDGVANEHLCKDVRSQFGPRRLGKPGSRPVRPLSGFSAKAAASTTAYSVILRATFLKVAWSRVRSRDLIREHVENDAIAQVRSGPVLSLQQPKKPEEADRAATWFPSGGTNWL